MRTHVVQPGETLQTIAARYNTTAAQIFQISAFRSGDQSKIYPGEVANIPDDPNEERSKAVDFGFEENEVHAKINGRIFTGWSGANIQVSIDDAVSAFSVSAPYATTNEQLRLACKPFGYTEISVYVGNTLVLTGFIEKVALSSAPDSNTVTLTGRSKTALLVDCSIPTDLLSVAGLTLEQMAREFCGPFGIHVKIDEDTKKINDAKPEPGTSFMEFLKSQADAQGYIITDNEYGDLVFRKKAAYTGEPVMTLREGEGYFTGGSAEYDGSERFNSYLVMAQISGRAKEQYDVEDRGVPMFRPKIIVQSECEFGSVQAAAEWERALAFSRSVSVSTSVAEWRTPDGHLWNRGDIVSLYAPSLHIIRESPFVVASVNFTIDSGSRATGLTLTLPETYSGEMPSVYPWGEG